MVSEQTEKRLEIAGSLQGKVMIALVDGPSSGVELLKKLNLKSPGTIYPVLKTLKMEGFIEYAPEKIPRKKMYVLSEKGKEQLKLILLGISRGLFANFIEPYADSFINVIDKLIKLTPEQKVLCTLDYEPIKRWVRKANVTYLPAPGQPLSTYDVIFSAMIGTLIVYGWKRDELALYLSTLVKSLQPGGSLVMVEIDKTENIFAEIFFKDVLGYGKAPGISHEELKELLEYYHLKVRTLHRWKGLLISISTLE